jgi:hypothetical protein
MRLGRFSIVYLGSALDQVRFPATHYNLRRCHAAVALAEPRNVQAIGFQRSGLARDRRQSCGAPPWVSRPEKIG